MSVLIGHASIDENKRTKGGIAGDQTGKEVCTRLWYNGSWDYVLRCKNPVKADKMASICESICNNPYVGYDQNERNSLIKMVRMFGYDVKNINVPCECDCSSLMAVCAECAGIKVYSSTNAPTTTSMKSVYMATGQFEILTSLQYLITDKNLKRGDILVHAGHHTVMVLNNTAAINAKTESEYIIGKTYTLDANLYIRLTPNGDKLEMYSLTTNAQLNAYTDDEGYCILRKGTRVTCKSIKVIGNQVWMQIPSGWVCAKEKEKVYIE